MSEESKLLNSEWIIGKVIGQGGFGSIHVTANIQTNSIAAVKMEDRRLSELLPNEANIVKNMNGEEGFPKFHWAGNESNHSYNYCLVEELLGPSLNDLFILCGNNFSLKTTLLIAFQGLQRLEQFHSKNYLHRDIKPENFAMVGFSDCRESTNRPTPCIYSTSTYQKSTVSQRR